MVFQFDDAVVAKELAMSDSEHSDADVSFTENGTFNLSRGQTPLTEGSEGRNKGLEDINSCHFLICFGIFSVLVCVLFRS